MTSRYRTLDILSNFNTCRAMGLIPSTALPPKNRKRRQVKDRLLMSNSILPMTTVSRELGKHALLQGLGAHTRLVHQWVL